MVTLAVPAPLANHELHAALALGEEMLHAAEGGDWERVMALQPARESHLRVFAGSASGAPPELLQRVLHANEALARSASARRDELAEQTRNLRHRQRAASAYGRAAG